MAFMIIYRSPARNGNYFLLNKDYKNYKNRLAFIVYLTGSEAQWVKTNIGIHNTYLLDGRYGLKY